MCFTEEYTKQIEHHLEEVEAAEQAELSAQRLKTSSELIQQLMQAGGQTFEQNLASLWDGFIEQTSATIKNFLGIAHLGYVLEHVYAQKLAEQKQRAEQRSSPDWLPRGKPNLLAIPECKIYQMVLTIYEHDEKYETLSRNEVLLCNTKTRVEEVRLFLNRALADPNSYYCMVNCHLLNYDVCRVIETRLSNTADDTVKDYGLAFIYAEEKRDARIRAYLDKYLVKNPLHKKNLCAAVRTNKHLSGKDITIPVYKTVDTDVIIKRLNDDLGNGYGADCYHTIHFDIAHEVESGVDELLFNLIILRSLVNSEGVVWQAQPTQYYIIECMPFTKEGENVHEVLDLLPTTMCYTPDEVLRRYGPNGSLPRGYLGFDHAIFKKAEWQIVFKFLHCLEEKDSSYTLSEEMFDKHSDALGLLIRNCGLANPTWSELRHFVYFLSSQLFKVQASPYCSHSHAGDMPGFRKFVVEFMFKMAQDFATRSLKIAEETPGLNLDEVGQAGSANLLNQLSMKKTWESENHPYLFFNEDGATFTPLGFYVEASHGSAKPYSLVDCNTKEIISEQCIARNLKRALDEAKLAMSENFNMMGRKFPKPYPSDRIIDK
ncbi:E3 ubiquitin-protein ligase rnf213-alpha-like [Watersipora subatra]|uniref:E3 ubiquitin-protein ligase rnf213-alpha-like n=1 Tax=Watersipora subatra TaxID=2589382 RepID=UPI00355AD49D